MKLGEFCVERSQAFERLQVLPPRKSENDIKRYVIAGEVTTNAARTGVDFFCLVAAIGFRDLNGWESEIGRIEHKPVPYVTDSPMQKRCEGIGSGFWCSLLKPALSAFGAIAAARQRYPGVTLRRLANPH